MKLDVTRSCEVSLSARMLQLGSMFDLPQTGRSSISWSAELPLDEREWRVGMIVGPSGSGKSTVARELFGDRIVTGFQWPVHGSAIDAFPASMSIKDISALLGSVGFNSPPSWMRPFHVLSNGEQFRVTIARALAEAGNDTVVVDEFTSVVDRQVAKVAAHCVGKTVRRRAAGRFVAASCHYDVIDWLQPDWLFQPATGEFQWRELQRRPALRLEVYQIGRSAWRMFAPHHYLSGHLASGAECFGGYVDGQLVGFTSHIHFPHARVRNIRHGHRLVVLPDFQGLGIGGRLDDWLGQHLWDRGFRYRNVVAHPAMIAQYSRSPRWHHDAAVNFKPQGGRGGNKSLAVRHATALVRRTITFEYRPPAKEKAA